jgi:hypothetical protein
MVKKLFALASVTALTGLITAVAASGCSSTETINTDVPETGGGDVKVEAAKKPDAEPEETGPAVCPTTDPITAADIEAQLQWLPPAAVQTVCTQQNIDDLKALFKAAPAGGGVKYVDIKKSLGTACAACAFSPIKGPNWQVFVEDTSGAIDNRTGSCFAQLENADCGKKRFQWESCLDAACPETDCGADKVQACTQKAQKGACKDLTDVYAKACPNETDILPICGNIFSAIAVSCSGGPDAGIDASTN